MGFNEVRLPGEIQPKLYWHLKGGGNTDALGHQGHAGVGEVQLELRRTITTNNAGGGGQAIDRIYSRFPYWQLNYSEINFVLVLTDR